MSKMYAYVYKENGGAVGESRGKNDVASAAACSHVLRGPFVFSTLQGERKKSAS